MKSADEGRAAVYAAEIAAFEGTSYESITAFDALVALAATVTTAPWWPHGPVDVRRARTDASSSSARQRGIGAPVVRLAAPQMTPATLVHELAHALAGVAAGHGPRFRRAHVDLVAYVFGDTEAGWLLDAYAHMGLAPGPRWWPSPPIRHEAGGPVAL
jgi:putative metallohydrolase (TIGR04338 family)